MNYYIFRHGESYFSKHHIPYGKEIESAEILAEGIPTSKKVGKYLAKKNIDVYFSSPYKRCVQTAEIIERITNEKFILDARIGEEMINRKKETFEKLVKRLRNFLDYIESKRFEGVAICSHGWPIAVLVALITKGEAKLRDLDNYPKPGILIEIKNKSISSLDFNN